MEAAERERDETKAELAALGNRLAAAIAESVKTERARADAAEAKAARARETARSFLAEYGDSTIPAFKVAIDLANATVKALGAPVEEASCSEHLEVSGD